MKATKFFLPLLMLLLLHSSSFAQVLGGDSEQPARGQVATLADVQASLDDCQNVHNLCSQLGGKLQSLAVMSGNGNANPNTISTRLNEVVGLIGQI